jgi:hypothetical protein
MIVIILGIIFSFVKWSKYPKASKLALAGLGILFFTSLLTLGLTVVRVQLPSWLDGDYKMMSYINIGIGIFVIVIWTIALSLLIFAVWAGREEK